MHHVVSLFTQQISLVLILSVVERWPGWVDLGGWLNTHAEGERENKTGTRRRSPIPVLTGPDVERRQRATINISRDSRTVPVPSEILGVSTMFFVTLSSTTLRNVDSRKNSKDNQSINMSSMQLCQSHMVRRNCWNHDTWNMTKIRWIKIKNTYIHKCIDKHLFWQLSRQSRTPLPQVVRAYTISAWRTFQLSQGSVEIACYSGEVKKVYTILQKIYPRNGVPNFIRIAPGLIEDIT